jgi:hypothetical protein
MAEVQDDIEIEEPVQKEKKPRTQAQIDAWNKAQATRIENAKAKKENKVKQYVETKIETLKKKLPPPKKVIQEVESDSSDEEEPEPEVVVVRVPKKVKKPKPVKKQIRVELEEDEFSDEDEPLVKPKVAPQKPPPKPVPKESPIAPRLYFV